ncbi:Putative uncharacterized protein [Staphylococcus xylosus]|nr:Putative uncharacterized protein [Staphylococcus xylosus]
MKISKRQIFVEFGRRQHGEIESKRVKRRRWYYLEEKRLIR